MEYNVQHRSLDAAGYSWTELRTSRAGSAEDSSLLQALL